MEPTQFGYRPILLEQGNEEEGLQWLVVGDKHHDAASAETLGDFYSGVFNKRKTNYDSVVFYYERAVRVRYAVKMSGLYPMLSPLHKATV